MIYFCPITCAWEPINRGLFESTVDVAFTVDAYCWYADNNGALVYNNAASGCCVNNTTGNKLNNVTAW